METLSSRSSCCLRACLTILLVFDARFHFHVSRYIFNQRWNHSGNSFPTLSLARKAEMWVRLSKRERRGWMNSPINCPNNLTWENSPVSRYMDELDEQRWSGLSITEHRIIEPTNRLASAMIESAISLAFLRALMYKPRIEITTLPARGDLLLL